MERTSAQRSKDPARLAQLIDGQHGVVAVWQMEECGFSRWAVQRSVAAQEFQRVHRGVVTPVGQQLRFSGHCMAAVLACGLDGLVSHHAAMAVYDLRPKPQAVIDVTAPGKRRHTGIRCHVSAVPAGERTRIDGIPVTTLERTFLDYAEQATPRQLRRALEEAERRQILDRRKLRAVMDDHPGRRGLRPLAHAITNLTDDPQWTQSPLEELFLELIRAANLPLPRSNILVHGELVDFAWPQQRLIVEIDSYAFHSNREAFESDRRRDAQLQKRGWRVLRFTDRRLHEEPEAVLAEVRGALNQ